MRRYAEEQVLDLQHDVFHCPYVSCELFCRRPQNIVMVTFGLGDLPIVLLLWSSTSLLGGHRATCSLVLAAQSKTR